jgi:glucose-1-phosphate adenylyltransferase
VLFRSLRGFVEILAAQQTNENSEWYQGTADAVRRNIRYVKESGCRYVLVLSGDQLYRMDFGKMLETHQQANADVTIAAVPVHSEAAASLGIMRLADDGRVVGFLEKPKTPEELAIVRTPPEWIDARGVRSMGRDCLASMGIYLFNADTLVKVLEKIDYQDFGKEIFPASIRTRHVHVHLFDGYWEDIGTIRSFFEANLGLAAARPPFELAVSQAPIFSRARFLPPSRLDGATVTSSLIGDGCLIGEGAVIENSVIGLRCRIGRDVVIRNSILMGDDSYQSADEQAEAVRNNVPLLGIGDGAVIEGAIIDKNARIGCGARILNSTGAQDTEENAYGMIRDGVVLVDKGATVPDGWTF